MLTLISVSVPPSCYLSSTQKIPVILSKVQVAVSKCEMSKSAECRQKVPSAKTERLFRLASHLGGRDREKGAGEGCGDGPASRTADAGRGEIRKVVGVIGAIS